jgi:hypothetical protein
MLNHLEMHQLERRIADVVEKGFGGKLDRADCLQVGFDVAFMLADSYLMDDREVLVEKLAERGEAELPFNKPLADAVRDLKQLLAMPKNGLEEAISPSIARVAGLGGGLGEEQK